MACEEEGARENLAARIVVLEREVAELRARPPVMHVVNGPMWVSDWLLKHELAYTWVQRQFVHPERRRAISRPKTVCLYQWEHGWLPARFSRQEPSGSAGASGVFTLDVAKELTEMRLIEWWASPASNRHRSKVRDE